MTSKPMTFIDALRCQRQLDQDGDEVGVSRQAVDEAINEIERLTLEYLTAEMRSVPWTEEQRAEFQRNLPTYQRYDAMKLVREAARLLAEPGDKVLYRDAFRWHDDADDLVMSNHYELQSIDYLAYAGITNDLR